MTITLKLSQQPDIPVEAETITPSDFVNKTISSIERLPLQQGNRSCVLEEFFEVDGAPTNSIRETEIVLRGDLSRFKMIGRRMNGGRITVKGDIGMYLGAEMIAGRIHVTGSVGSWTAAEMQGGNIQIEGDAADYLCGGYRGSADGMQGGRVYIAGSVGRDMASHMRRGFIAVKGSVGENAAARMKGGSIVVLGDIDGRAGVQATRGMLFVAGQMKSIFPTYRFSGIAQRPLVDYYLRYVLDRRPDFFEEREILDAKWLKFVGDFAEEDPRMEMYLREGTSDALVQDVE
ncbi:formylmethanofuran dehydrogenase subunit C [Candidatus Thorarchaeota archaeon]|nr:MAG: formylmethanofuran dehydrogenase subunit C [Candidatus Thorarchaeota archaeon]